jgi:hypothetical protein
MIVSHMDNHMVSISMDTFYAKILCEYLRACISTDDVSPKVAANYLANDGWSVPPEQIISGMQTLQSTMSRFTDAISKKSGPAIEEATETIH